MKSYPEYKETKVEQVGKLPSHWKVMPLKYAALVNREALTEQVEEDFELQYIDIGNVNQLGLVNAPERMKFIDAPSRARRIIKKNDTIISTVRTYLKAVAFIDRDDNNLVASTGFATLTSLNETHPKYLYYLVSNQGFVDTVSACSTGVSYPAITSTELARITAWLPSLPEQQAIADFLDRKTAQIDTLIEKKQRQIDLLQEQRTALINHAVTKGLNPKVKMKDSGVEWLGEIPSHWEVKRMKWLCNIKRGASPRPIDDVIYFDEKGEYAWVRISNVTASEMYLYETDQQLSELGASKSVKLEPNELFVSIAASVGKPIINKIKCCIHDGFVWLQGLEQSKEYYFYIFSGGELYKGLGKIGTQLNLNSEYIANIYVPVPPKNEQNQIVDFLLNRTAQVDSLIKQVEQQIQLYQEYRTTLISEAVTGKIDVRTVV